MIQTIENKSRHTSLFSLLLNQCAYIYYFLDKDSMSIKKTNDKDIFENVIDIGLRMYGNGYPYPRCIVDYINEYCRQQMRHYFLKHNQLTIICKNDRISFLKTLVYTSRHKKACLKRLQQFLQTKDRSTSQQQEELSVNIVKDKKLTSGDRFIRICRQIQIHINNTNQNKVNHLCQKIIFNK